MKRLVFLALMVATATVAACGDDGGNPPVGAGNVSATVEGSAFTGSLAVTSSRTATVLAVGAVGSNNRQIAIFLTGVTSTGAVAVGAGSSSYAQYSDASQQWVSNLTGGSGTVNLTTLTTTHAAGTFTFTGAALATSGASGTKSVTSGSFDVSY